jgi:fructokinase
MKNKICIGAGLVSLDVLIRNNDNRPISYYVGGTCGNIIMILSYLGWNSYPIARLDGTKYTERLLEDMKSNKVKTDFISTNDGSTPVIIQRNIVDKDGLPTHKFEIKNNNGRFYLNFRSITKKQADDIISKITFVPDVFFFDRISPAIIQLARHFRDAGAIIYFEPSEKITEKNFSTCIEISDIIKFADQRIPVVDFANNYKNKLFIQTQGLNGLIYKFKNEDWKRILAWKNQSIMDTSGAGDWTTSVFINKIFVNNINSILDLKKEFIEASLVEAQKYGSYSCSFEGARGMMSINIKELENRIESLY